MTASTRYQTPDKSFHDFPGRDFPSLSSRTRCSVKRCFADMELYLPFDRLFLPFEMCMNEIAKDLRPKVLGGRWVVAYGIDLSGRYGSWTPIAPF